MVATVLAVTAVVVMVNTGDTDAPPATVTEAGTAATALLLASVTTAPLEAAGPVSVTVLAIVDVPPTTDAGDKVTAEALGGNTVNVAVAGVPL